MDIGTIPDHLKTDMRRHFLSGLKESDSVDMYEFELFRWFKNETEKTWSRMNEEEKQYIKEQVASGAEVVNDSGIFATDYYRSRMRSSQVIFLASLLESAMKRECDRLSHVLGDQAFFKPYDLKGNPWHVRKIFLERYGQFEIPDSLWQPITKLLAIRNALVHCNGDVLLLNDEHVSTLRKIPGISVDSPQVGVAETYVDGAIDSTRAVVEFLNVKINEVIDRSLTPEGVS